MKKNIVFMLLMVLCIGITADTYAQKKKSKKKKGAKTETTTDTKPAAVAPTPEPVADIPAEDTGVSTPDNLVADADSFNFNDIALDTTKPTDGYIKMANLKGAKPFPFPKEDKNSVKPFKRIWREINLADTENKILATPDDQLIKFLMDAVKNGKLIAYEDESFKKKMSYAKAIKQFREKSLLQQQDSVTGEVIGSKEVYSAFNPDSVTKFEIKEDIYFDKIRGRVYTEIVYLAPIRKVKATSGMVIDENRAFFLSFPKCRNLLAAKEVFDLSRDISNMSYDDYFIQRQFKSTIVKQSNSADMRIKDIYPDKERQLKEANRIEREIARYKKNIWKFS